MKIKKSRQQIFDEARQVYALMQGGSPAREACEKVGLHLVSYYKYRRQALGESPADGSETLPVTTVQIHEPIVEQKKPKKIYQAQKFNSAPCAVFVGDVSACARFIKEFQ